MTKTTQLPIVLLHGFCMDDSIWDEVIEHLDSDDILKIDYTTTMNKEPFLIETLAEKIGFYLESEDVSRCILIGHSMGGYLALELLAQYPDLVAGLGLINSHPFTDLEDRVALRKKSIAHINKYGCKPYIKQAIPTWVTPDFATNHADKVTTLVDKAIEKYNSNAVVYALDAMINRLDHSETLKNAEVPVLFINGEKDETIPLDFLQKQVHLPKIADIHVLKDVAHIAPIEQPKIVADLVNKFIQMQSLFE